MRKNKMVLFLLLFSVMSAFSDSVYIPFSSYHMYKERGNKEFVLESGKYQYNEFNPGIIYKWDNNLKLGVYKNSEYKWSALLGYDVGLYNNDYIDFGISLNLVTGYSENTISVIPTFYLEINNKFRIEWIKYIAITPQITTHYVLLDKKTNYYKITKNNYKTSVNVFGFSYKLN